MQLRFYHLSLLWIKIRAFIHSFKNNRYLKYFTWREPCGQEAGVNLKPPMGHSPGCAPEGGLLWPCTHRPKNVSQHFLRTLCTKWKWIQWTLGKEKTQVIFHQMYSAVKANGNSAGRGVRAQRAQGKIQGSEWPCRAVSAVEDLIKLLACTAGTKNLPLKLRNPLWKRAEAGELQSPSFMWSTSPQGKCSSLRICT